MKKLLLILICLFVSLEVQSSDDLTGKKLLCDNSDKGFFKKYFNLRGIEFLSSNEIQFHRLIVDLDSPLGKPILINHRGKYEIDSGSIKINLFDLYEREESNKFFISRRSLKLTGWLLEYEYECEIKSGNYTKMFKEKYNKLTKKLEKLKKKHEKKIKDEYKI